MTRPNSFFNQYELIIALLLHIPKADPSIHKKEKVELYQA